MPNIYFNSTNKVLLTSNNFVLYEIEGTTTTTTTTAAPTTTTTTTSSPMLTYPGSTHTEADVIALGGSIYTIGSIGDPNKNGKTIGRVYGSFNSSLQLNNLSGWNLATANYPFFRSNGRIIKQDGCGYTFFDNDYNFGNNDPYYSGPGGHHGYWISCAHYAANYSLGEFWMTGTESLWLVGLPIFGGEISEVGIY